eukprot:gnl/TRDRNA2_/TRDRNA2_41885_c0_seq1.p1 gnl/TRDRNA2_/TRDRNA2_41885_c0~~gnl/TRDRNA2_/TRDRNA2_41885_c0_seq1.p1  ORF type:complete len:525 (-),score=160.55 gnl/TRDRNA2_/TRDRNA2_41885_c0_seq1:113-1687(-)
MLEKVRKRLTDVAGSAGVTGALSGLTAGAEEPAPQPAPPKNSLREALRARGGAQNAEAMKAEAAKKAAEAKALEEKRLAEEKAAQKAAAAAAAAANSESSVAAKIGSAVAVLDRIISLGPGSDAAALSNEPDGLPLPATASTSAPSEKPKKPRKVARDLDSLESAGGDSEKSNLAWLDLQHFSSKAVMAALERIRTSEAEAKKPAPAENQVLRKAMQTRGGANRLAPTPSEMDDGAGASAANAGDAAAKDAGEPDAEQAAAGSAAPAASEAPGSTSSYMEGVNAERASWRGDLMYFEPTDEDLQAREQLPPMAEEEEEEADDGREAAAGGPEASTGAAPAAEEGEPTEEASTGEASSSGVEAPANSTPPRKAAAPEEAGEDSTSGNLVFTPPRRLPGKSKEPAQDAPGDSTLVSVNREELKQRRNDAEQQWRRASMPARTQAAPAELEQIKRRETAAAATSKVRDMKDFWGKKSTGFVGNSLDDKTRISKGEAEVALQRLLSSSTRTDLDEVRRLRKMLSQADA